MSFFVSKLAIVLIDFFPDMSSDTYGRSPGADGFEEGEDI